MEKVTAPGISCASITHCQDWRRLLCQNNNVDIHHERPSPCTPSSLPNQWMCVCVCVFMGFPTFQSVLYETSHHRSLSLLGRVSLLQYWLSLSWLNQLLPPHFPFHFHTITAHPILISFTHTSLQCKILKIVPISNDPA